MIIMELLQFSNQVNGKISLPVINDMNGFNNHMLCNTTAGNNFILILLAALTLIMILLLIITLSKNKSLKAQLSEKQEAYDKQKKQLTTIDQEIEKKVKERTEELEIELNEQQQFEDALNDALEKAKEANFLKDTFLSNLSFGMRTPMNAIIGYSELIKEKGVSLEEKENYIETISNSSKLLVNIINDVLDMSDIEAGQIKINKDHFSVNILIDDLYNFFNSEKSLGNKDNVNLIVKKGLDDTNSIINSDQTKLQQVLTQLISNAIKFTDKGNVEFGYTVKNNDLLQFYVKDNGPGLSKEEQDMIFEKYMLVDKPDSKTKSESGLGLAIAKAYIELLGGKIWVESIENKGSTFYFTIAYNKEPGSNTHETTMEDKNNWSDKTFLIVEDDKSSSRFLQEVLKRTGARLIFTSDGEKAIEICEAEENLDLILMDVQLPTLSGYEATKRIKKMRPNLPVIAQTANAFADERNKAMEAGCSEYITKPLNKEKLLTIINSVLKK